MCGVGVMPEFSQFQRHNDACVLYLLPLALIFALLVLPSQIKVSMVALGNGLYQGNNSHYAFRQISQK